MTRSIMRTGSRGLPQVFVRGFLNRSPAPLAAKQDRPPGDRHADRRAHRAERLARHWADFLDRGGWAISRARRLVGTARAVRAEVGGGQARVQAGLGVD